MTNQLSFLAPEVELLLKAQLESRGLKVLKIHFKCEILCAESGPAPILVPEFCGAAVVVEVAETTL